MDGEYEGQVAVSVSTLIGVLVCRNCPPDMDLIKFGHVYQKICISFILYVGQSTDF